MSFYILFTFNTVMVPYFDSIIWLSTKIITRHTFQNRAIWLTSTVETLFFIMESTKGIPSSTVIRKTLAKSIDTVRRLKEICESSLRNLESGEKSADIAQCDELKASIEKLTQFVNTPSKKTAVVNKLLQVERKRRWKLKRRRLYRVKSSFYRTMLNQRNK